MMLSIERCKELLNVGDSKYTDCEIKQLRELLYTLADIELNQIEKDLGNNKGNVIAMRNYFLQDLKAA